MVTLQTEILTAEEFYERACLPENRSRICELEQGRIVERPLPGKLHGLVCANVTGILGNFTAQRKKGYICSNGTGVIVERNPDTVRGADVLLFEDAEKLEQVDEQYGETPPVLAVDVVTPADKWGKMLKRVKQFLRRGVKLVWVVDPAARTVSLHRSGQEPDPLDEIDELVCEDVLPGFRCRIADFFTLPGESS